MEELTNETLAGAQGTEETQLVPGTAGAPAQAAQEETASGGVESETPQTGGELFTLKHLDEQREVGRDEVIALAQKGLDYDRIRADRDRLKGGDAPQRREGLADFLRAFPDVEPAAIPKQVWMRFAQGESLTTAYTMHRNQLLEAELAAARQNGENARRATGSLASSGKTADGDDLLHSWYAEE